jgi:tetratricopeptide (TPR) repeat protein
MTSDRTALMTLMASRQYEEALAECEQLLAADPSDRETSMTAGLCHSQLGRWAGATDCFLAAGGLDGGDTVALLMLAGCYENLGQAEAAERCVKKVIEAGCDPDDVVGGLALIQQMWGDWPKAAANYEIALKDFAKRVLRQMSEHNGRDTQLKCWPGRQGNDWLKYADLAWTQAISDCGLAGFVLPTRVMFADEEFGQQERGLYWRDIRQQDGTLLRQYLPNGVHTFLYRCYDSKDYQTMVRGRAIALTELGRPLEAEPYRFEASLFQHLEITSDSALSATDPGLMGFVGALLSGIRSVSHHNIATMRTIDIAV